MWVRRLAGDQLDTGISVFGAILVLAGILVLHAGFAGPLRWQALQDTLSAVFPNPRSIILGSGLIIMGATCFAWPGSPVERGLDVDASRQARARLDRWLVIAGGMALLLYGVTVARLLTGATGYSTGLLFVAALVVSAFAVCRCYPALPALFTRRELILLALAALAACVLYLHDAGWWFYTGIGDEYQFFTFARSIDHGYPVNVFSQQGVYGYHPVADSLFQAATMHLLGEDSLGWKASCALAAATTLFPVYLIARLAYSRLAGMLAAGIYLPANLLLAYVHIGYNNLDALFPVTAALALLLAGRVYAAPFYLFLAGVFAGIGWYTFLTGRFAIFLLGLGFLLYRPGSLRAVARDAGLILAGFALVVVPFVLINGSSIVSVLSGQSSLTGHQHSASLRDLLTQNAVRSLFAFVYSTQVDNHYVVGAMFDTLSALFLLLGLTVLIMPGAHHGKFILLWYWSLLALTGVPFYAPSIPTTRINIVLPAACVIAGIGAATLIVRLHDLLGVSRRYGATFWGVAAVAILGVAALNFDNFYQVMPRRVPAQQFAMEVEVITSHPRATVVIAPDLASYNFPAPMQIYGIQPDRVVQAFGSMQTALARARRRHRPVLVVSGSDLPDVATGRTQVLWDPSHVNHLVLTLGPGGQDG